MVVSYVSRRLRAAATKNSLAVQRANISALAPPRATVSVSSAIFWTEILLRSADSATMRARLESALLSSIARSVRE